MDMVVVMSVGNDSFMVAQEDHIRFALFCKPVSGASDNLRVWWKEKVKFDWNGLAAIAKYQADNLVPGKFDDCIAVASKHQFGRDDGGWSSFWPWY
ncbi:hypothetical protein RJ639_003801 [Escallonia herrerae]|uniref:Ethylene insensitive 3-like DNA-binding domain-containing protein n=1 Tax=Escallonia herrerae TaxID=1293975 RepID=A0AA88W0H6_9ASTE|nr:hypothetical protein RJ639_003801 [Escallonia herrerae]